MRVKAINKGVFVCLVKKNSPAALAGECSARVGSLVNCIYSCCLQCIGLWASKMFIVIFGKFCCTQMALQVFSYQGDDYNSPVNVPAFPLLESAGFFFQC